MPTYFQDLCYGYNVDLIAQWCEVDVQTARHYKAGTRTPGKQALALFVLYRDGRIVPAEWQGFSFRGSKLFDPWGKELSHAQLRAWPIAMQMLREFARGDAARTRDVDMLMTPTGPAPVTLGRQVLRASEALPAQPPAEPQASDPVRHVQAETIRRRHRQRSASPTTTAFEELSPQLRDVARQQADR